MDLQAYLTSVFPRYIPSPPDTVSRGQHDVTLNWRQAVLDFLEGALLYRLERKEMLPPWVVEYSGSKITRKVHNLAPCCPHKFRLKVIIKASAVPRMADLAIKHYGSEDVAKETLKEVFKEFATDEDANANGGNTEKFDDGAVEVEESVADKDANVIKENTGKVDDGNVKYKDSATDKVANAIEDNFAEGDNRTMTDDKFEQSVANVHADGDQSGTNKSPDPPQANKACSPWLESQYSELMTTSTASVGTSAAGFCMAVRGGYLKHVQMMLEERPELIGIINNTDGYTPLATAIKNGDLAMVKYLLSMGAEVNQRFNSWQTPLHLAVLNGSTALVDLLLEKGADITSRDRNALGVEHYAVDSGDLLMVCHVLGRGGRLSLTDSNGWTPLFRAVVQGAPTDIIEELVRQGSDVNVVDHAGLSLIAAAYTLKNRHGKRRDSVLRLVDPQYPHYKARAAFTRVTKKISNVHSLIKH